MSLIGKSVGNYQIKAKLGEGGMGAVYLGEHPLIGKRVAVKVLLEELSSKEDIVQRFFNEAKAVNDIGHQNIVDIVDFGKMKNDAGGGDIVYFIMEFLDGESLAARLRRTGLSFKETLHVNQQCCSALAASHAKGIVHRDLKPENIYLCPRGNDKNFVKILDFGIAKLTGDTGQSHKTRTGLVIGTPTYMSPEQCEGKGLIDHRSDVYSLGVVMYEELTGRVPFPGDGFGEILVAHLTRTPDAPRSLNPDISPELEALVLHAIEKDKNRRYQSMAEFEAAVMDPAAHYAQYSQLPGYSGSVSASTSNHGTMVLGGDAPTVRGPSGVMPTVKGPMTGSGPRPTTLSGAASEMEGAPPKSKAPMIVVAVAGLAILGVGGFVLFKPKPAEQPQTPVVQNPQPPPEPVKPPPPKEEFVKVSITSDPTNAKVFRAGKDEPDGVTPLDLKLKKGEPSFDIQVKLDGYKTETKAITSEVNKEVIVTLAKNPEAAVAVVAPPKPDKPDKPDSKHHDHVSSGDKKKGDKKKGGEEGGADDMKLLTPKF
jgi:eukaryotic-like serine/threonine-protein kinase